MERKIYQHNRHFITLNSRTRRLHSLTPNAYRPPCLISHLATNHFPQLFHFLMLVDLAKLHQAFQSSIKTKEGAKAVIEYIAKNPRLFSQLQHKDFMNYTILKRRKLSKWRGSMHSERSEWERISWDIDRTHLWICRSLQQIDSMRCFLRRVIYRISAQLDRFSYVQGFHCIIRAMYQLRLNEQQAYMLGCYFLRQLKLNGYYENRMEKMREICYAFDVYVFNYLPELHQCLKRQDLSAQCYALSWFVTLYSQQLHAPVLSRLWVLFLLKGWKVMIKFGVALLCLFQSSLIQKNQDQLAESLRYFIYIFEIITITINLRQIAITLAALYIDQSHKQNAFLSFKTDAQFIGRQGNQRGAAKKYERSSFLLILGVVIILIIFPSFLFYYRSVLLESRTFKYFSILP